MASPYRRKTAEQVKMVVARMLQRRVKDPRLGPVVLTDARMSGDGSEATLFYTVLGDDQARADAAAGLASATGLLRTAVGRQLGLKFAPSLAFVHDALEQEASQFDEALAAARRHDAAVAEAAAEAAYAGDEDPYRFGDDE
ncbi:MAG: 30S ribosome-binding factor RbfA [Propionibacteriaceae bacterium]|jgi:ribosome-binding factor A|nr:30S ribosome-binding factor RbfA [Propionibacteriaceae bacterium]